ncbi:MAG: phosphotransferase family protein [Acidimicrobiales bacterium]
MGGCQHRGAESALHLDTACWWSLKPDLLAGRSGGRRAVIRRPPLGELLPKAHDMGREFTVIKALGPTDVPVPVAYGYCEDPSVTGAHFYVMSEVSGQAFYTTEDVEAGLSMDARVTLSNSFMDTLAALHALDPVAIGLGDLGRHDGYVSRQLRTWYGSWEASKEAAKYDDDRIHDLHRMLLSTLPEQGPPRVVHGDFGTHNVMVGSDGVITAVLDWEIATLGDPMADFAYALNAWVDEDDDREFAPFAATAAPGFLRRSALVERYSSITGCDVSQLDYYRSFNYFKTACILHGVYARYLMGQKSTEGVDMEGLYNRMRGSIELAIAQARDL